jgi:hypothetical protein
MTSSAKEQQTGKGPQDKEFTVHIDKKLYKTTETVLTGAQIRALAKPPIGPDYALWLEVPGGEDVLEEDNDSIDIREGIHFFTSPRQINPGGC